jgi:hypothetical protein
MSAIAQQSQPLSAATPVVESPEQAHRRRLLTCMERWTKIVAHYRAQRMTHELRGAERTLASYRRALEASGFLPS